MPLESFAAFHSTLVMLLK